MSGISTISAQLVSHFYKTVTRASVFSLQANFPPFSNLSTPDGEGDRVDLSLPMGPAGPRSKQMMEMKQGWKNGPPPSLAQSRNKSKVYWMEF